jgi:hypothetical protein
MTQNTEGPLSPDFKRYVRKCWDQITSSFFLEGLKKISHFEKNNGKGAPQYFSQKITSFLPPKKFGASLAI